MEGSITETRQRQIEMVRELFSHKKLSPADIAASMNLSRQTVYSLLRDAGVGGEQKGGRYRFAPPRDNEEKQKKIVEMYLQKVPIAQIARETLFSREWVYRTLEKHGVYTRGVWKPSALPVALQRELERNSTNFNQWRNRYGFPASLAYDVVMGRRKAVRGQSRMIKEQLIKDFPDVFTEESFVKPAAAA